jgi:hypothetical protein
VPGIIITRGLLANSCSLVAGLAAAVGFLLGTSHGSAVAEHEIASRPTPTLGVIVRVVNHTVKRVVIQKVPVYRTHTITRMVVKTVTVVVTATPVPPVTATPTLDSASSGQTSGSDLNSGPTCVVGGNGTDLVVTGPGAQHFCDSYRSNNPGTYDYGSNIPNLPEACRFDFGDLHVSTRVSANVLNNVSSSDMQSVCDLEREMLFPGQ